MASSAWRQSLLPSIAQRLSAPVGVSGSSPAPFSLALSPVPALRLNPAPEAFPPASTPPSPLPSQETPPSAAGGRSPPCSARDLLRQAPWRPWALPWAPVAPALPQPRAQDPSLRRGMATSSVPAGAVMHQKQLKVYLQSPGVLADPYRPPPPRLPFFKRFFTRAGWKRIREGMLGTVRTGYAIAQMWRNIKGHTQQGFYSEMAHIYSKINKSLASDDRTTLRHFVTETAYSSMKHQLKMREQSGVSRALWKLAGTAPPKMSTLQARLVALDKNKPENAFLQITVKIRSKQVVAVYSKKGNLLGGDPEKEIDVEDIWVFERHLTQPSSHWRMCGQLATPPNKLSS